MMLPQSIDQDSGRHRMLWIGQPPRQCRTVERAFWWWIKGSQKLRKGRSDQLALSLDTATLEYVRLRRFGAVFNRPRLWRWLGHQGFELVNLLAQCEAFLCLRRVQGIDDLIPGDLDQNHGLRGELLLFLRPFGRWRIECFPEWWVKPGFLLGLNSRAKRALNRRQLLLQWGELFADFLGSPGMLGLLLSRGNIEVLGLGCGKEGFEGIIIPLGDGIELMVVAESAVERQTQESKADGASHLGKYFLANHLGVQVAADQMNLTAAMKTRGDQKLFLPLAAFGRCQNVPADLLGHEAVERQVSVEGTRHIVAVAPGMRAGPVNLVTIGFGITNDIQPVLSPALAVMWGRKKSLDESFIGIGPGVRKESSPLDVGRGQPGKREADAAEQGFPLGLGGRREAFFFKPGQNEGIHGGAKPVGALNLRGRGVSRLLKCPVGPAFRLCRLGWIGQGNGRINHEKEAGKY